MSEMTDGVKQTLLELANDAKKAKDKDYEKLCRRAAERCDWPIVQREADKLLSIFGDEVAPYELAVFLMK